MTTTEPQSYVIQHAHAELVDTVDVSEVVIQAAEEEDEDDTNNDGGGDGRGPRDSSTINVFQLSLGSTTIILSELGASVMNWYIIDDDDGNDQDDKDGYDDTNPTMTDIVVGFKDVKTAYVTKNPVYFGTVCGRVANRIGGGQFTISTSEKHKDLDDRKTYQLPVNDTPRQNTLHGGPYGLSHKIWNGSLTKQGTAVQFVVKSHDNDQGFPGTLKVTATYSLRPSITFSKDGERGVVLTLQMKAELVEPSDSIQTPVNLTNHTYFNLEGSDSAYCTTKFDDDNDRSNNTKKKSGNGILNHKLMLECDDYTPVDTETLITTKKVLPVSSGGGTMDFRSPKLLRDCIQSIGLEQTIDGLSRDSIEVNEDLNGRQRVCSSPYGLDHNFVVRNQDGLALPRVAQLVSGNTGSSGSGGRRRNRRRRKLTVYSNSPGVQVYTANYLDPDDSITNSDKCKTSYGPWSAICLETQHFPDSISYQKDCTDSTFWAGRCPILSIDRPTYEQTVEYCLEELNDEGSNGDDDVDSLVVGCDTNDVTFTSIEAMWSAQNLSDWYGRAADWYEENCPTTIDGVLGGIGHVSDTDLAGSRRFLQSLFCEVNNDPTTNKSIRMACEIGAGIGRVTKGLLLDFADRCDLVESSPRLLASAPDHLGNRMAAKCRFFCNSLQEWKPPSTAKYSIIWIQWVLCYLTDKDAVEFLKRCAGCLDDGGYIILKENVCEEQMFVVDADDASLTRSVGYWNDLIAKSGLRLCTITFQDDFPDEIYPVPMIALRHW